MKIIPNSSSLPEPENIREAWSPAARAASSASRSKRGHGKMARRDALRKEYFKTSGTDPFSRAAGKVSSRKTKTQPGQVTAKELHSILKPRRRRR